MKTRRAILAAGALVAADAFVVEPRWLRITRSTVRIRSLPASLDGWTLAHITDVHLPASLGMLHEAVAKACRTVQCVVLTGDAIDRPDRLSTLEQFVSAVRPERGTLFATSGNWEHWGHIAPAELARAYTRAGGRWVSNESFEHNGVAFAATDDSCSGHEDLLRTLNHFTARELSLFLTHAPGVFDALPRDVPQFSLALAGHTHGGQVTAFSKAVSLPPGSGRFSHGWYETPLGRAYVSRGIGTSIVPARFFCAPELAIFQFQRA